MVKESLPTDRQLSRCFMSKNRTSQTFYTIKWVSQVFHKNLSTGDSVILQKGEPICPSIILNATMGVCYLWSKQKWERRMGVDGEWWLCWCSLDLECRQAITQACFTTSSYRHHTNTSLMLSITPNASHGLTLGAITIITQHSHNRHTTYSHNRHTTYNHRHIAYSHRYTTQS